jgi:hypothetical protein
MTAPRRPRSAWLLVGSTPSMRVKVESAGQRLRRLVAKRRWYVVFVLLRAACSSSARSSCLSGAIRSSRRARSPSASKASQAAEDAAGDREASRAEVLLGSEPLAVGGEVAHEVGRAELAPFGVEVVVGPAAVGAGDAGEVLAEQRPDLALVPVSGDSEDRCAGGERAPERALAAAQAPAGLVDVDGRRGADLKAKLAKGRHRRTESHDALRSRDCEKRRFKPVLDSRLVRNRRRVARCALWQLSRTATRDLQPTPRAASSSYTRPREYQIPSGLATRILKVAPAKA